MKKLLFVILLLPALATLGHDIYFYTQNQDKGFRLTDLGKLWDTYHKESHDQWKSKIDKLGETAEEIINHVAPKQLDNMGNDSEQTKTENEIFADFQQGFAQKDGKSGTEELPPPPKTERVKKESTDSAKKSIGFLLEQKAVFVFAAIPAILFILNALLGLIFGSRKNKDEKISKGKKQNYSRK